MKLKELKQGAYFTKKAIECPTERQVWVRGSYDRSTKKYDCWRFDDVCVSAEMPGNKEVFTDFVF